MTNYPMSQPLITYTRWMPKGKKDISGKMGIMRNDINMKNGLVKNTTRYIRLALRGKCEFRERVCREL